MADKIVLAQLDLDVQGLLKATNESKLAVTQLKNELLALKAAGETTSTQFTDTQQALQKLTGVMDAQIETLNKQIKKHKELALEQDSVVKATKKLGKEQESLTDTFNDNRDAMAGFAETSREAKAALDEVNRSVAQSGSSASGSAKTFNDFKKIFTDSVQSINIFNGDFGTFISNAEEAGGVGPLVTNAFNGMATGIGGMTKAALAFMATPLGFAIAAIAAVLSPVISYFKNTQEGIDKVTAVTRPLQAVFDALVVVFQNVGKFLVDAFTNPQKSITAFAGMIKENITNRLEGLLGLVPALGKAVGLLFEGEFSKAGKVAADAVGKVALGTDNITDKVAGAASATGKFFADAYANGKRMDQLQKALDKGLAEYTIKTSELKTQLDKHNTVADDTNKTFAEREAAAVAAIATAKEHNALMVKRLNQEIDLLQLKQASNGVTDAEKAELAEMVAKRDEALAQGAASEKAQTDKINAIRKESADKARELRQKAIDDALEKQKQELDLFVAQGSAKAKTLQESIKFEEDASQKSKDLLDAELKAKKISKAEYEKAVLENQNALTEKVAALNIKAANAEIEAYMLKLEYDKKHTILTIEEEQRRLAKIHDMRLNQLALEKGINQQAVADKIANNQQLTLAEQEFYNGKLQLEMDHQQQLDDQNEALRLAKEQKAAEQKAVDRELKLAEAQTEYEEKLILEDERHTAEVAKLEEWRAQDLISQEELDEHINRLNEETAKNKEKLAIQNMQTQLGTMQNVAGALGEAFGQSKELALAQATMNAGQAILSIWSGTISGNPVVDSVIKGALTASTAVKTAKQLKEIQSAKKPKAPKFESGGLMSIGGSRHSAGGTLFHGSDGTTFEAEQGELIGVMNRNAARHFMAFNNTFPSGGATAPNYFAGGGIVSREIASPTLNIDELAAKIALANTAIPAPVVSVEDIITQGNSYVKVREGANF